MKMDGLYRAFFRNIDKFLNHIKKLEIHIEWDQLIEFQYKCLKNGLNGVGIPDLIIIQNTKQNHCEIYSLDNQPEIDSNQ